MPKINLLTPALALAALVFNCSKPEPIQDKAESPVLLINDTTLRGAYMTVGSWHMIDCHVGFGKPCDCTRRIEAESDSLHLMHVMPEGTVVQMIDSGFARVSIPPSGYMDDSLITEIRILKHPHQ